MSGLEIVKEAMSRRRLYPGEPLDLELPHPEDEDQELDQLTRLRGEVAEVAAACRAVTGDIDQAIIANLGHLGEARLGPQFFKVATAEDIKIRPEQRSRFWHWVHTHKIADRLFNPNQARKGANAESGLRHMATLPDPETGEVMTWPEFRDTFFDQRALDRLELSVLPVDGASTAKWIKQLTDGWVRRHSQDDPLDPEREETEHARKGADPPAG